MTTQDISLKADFSFCSYSKLLSALISSGLWWSLHSTYPSKFILSDRTQLSFIDFWFSYLLLSSFYGTCWIIWRKTKHTRVYKRYWIVSSVSLLDTKKDIEKMKKVPSNDCIFFLSWANKQVHQRSWFYNKIHFHNFLSNQCFNCHPNRDHLERGFVWPLVSFLKKMWPKFIQCQFLM